MKIIIMFIIFIICSSSFFSQEKIEFLNLSLDDAVMLGLKNNLDIKSSELDKDKKKWDLVTCWNSFVPDVNLNTYLNFTNQERINNKKKDIQDIYGGSLSDADIFSTAEWKSFQKGSVGYSIQLNIKLNANLVFDIIYKTQDWKSGKISLDIAKRMVERNIKESYFTLVITDKNLNILEQNINSAQKRYELSIKKYELGIFNELETLKAQYVYEKLKQEYFELSKDYDNMMLIFKQIIGIKQEVETVLKDKIIIKNEYISILNSINQSSINNNLDLKLLNLDLKKKIQTRNLNIASLTPSINLSYLIDPAYQKNDPFGADSNWFANVNDDWRQNSGNFTINISMSFSSLFPFSSSQMTIAKSQYDIEKQKIDIKKTREDKILEVNKIVNTTSKAFNSFTSLNLNVRIAEKVYNLTEASYNIGKQSLLELTEAEKNLNNEKLKLLEAEYDYITGICKLEYLLNIHILDKD